MNPDGERAGRGCEDHETAPRDAAGPVVTARVSEGRRIGGRIVWAAPTAREIALDVLREVAGGDATRSHLPGPPTSEGDRSGIAENPG